MTMSQDPPQLAVLTPRLAADRIKCYSLPTLTSTFNQGFFGSGFVLKNAPIRRIFLPVIMLRTG
jgi:hypothetical protein